MKRLHLSIVSPEKEIYNGEVNSVTLPGVIGRSLFATACSDCLFFKEGKLSYVTEDNEECTLDIEGGL